MVRGKTLSAHGHACYKSIVSTRNKKYLPRTMSAHGVRTCPVYFSTRDNLPGHLAICVNNIIIMCIGLVHDIFTRNIYYGVDI